jgi:tyrosinase
VTKIDNYYSSASTEIRKSRMGDPNAGAQFLAQATLHKELVAQEAPATHQEKLRLISKMPEQQVLLKQSIGPDKPFLKDLAPDGTYLEWLVNIKAQKHVMGGRYSVNVFLGPVEEDNVSLWRLSPQFVGTFVPFGQPSTTGCGKCQDDQSSNLQVTSQIPLTIALIERYLAGILPDISAETVVPYLTKNLHWRVESGGSIVQDRSEIAGLTVFVVSNKVTLPESETELPIYDEDVTIYPEITTNMNGAGRGDGTGLTAGDQ